MRNTDVHWSTFSTAGFRANTGSCCRYRLRSNAVLLRILQVSITTDFTLTWTQRYFTESYWISVVEFTWGLWYWKKDICDSNSIIRKVKVGFIWIFNRTCISRNNNNNNNSPLIQHDNRTLLHELIYNTTVCHAGQQWLYSQHTRCHAGQRQQLGLAHRM